jgi:hypothetical protein
MFRPSPYSVLGIEVADEMMEVDDSLRDVSFCDPERSVSASAHEDGGA